MIIQSTNNDDGLLGMCHELLCLKSRVFLQKEIKVIRMVHVKEISDANYYKYDTSKKTVFLLLFLQRKLKGSATRSYFYLSSIMRG